LVWGKRKGLSGGEMENQKKGEFSAGTQKVKGSTQIDREGKGRR